jgi:hypothetical protein
MAASRGAAMKSISIMWAEGVTEAEAATVVNTVKQVVQVMYDLCFKAGVGLSPTAIRPFGTWVMPSIPAGDPYSGTHWYIQTAYDQARDQVLAPRFLELVKQEPWQIANPHFDVAVLDLDLTEGSGSVLGSVLPGTATVISVHRLRAIQPQEQRLRALRRLVVHNFGHVLEIPRDGRLGGGRGGGRGGRPRPAALRRVPPGPDAVGAGPAALAELISTRSRPARRRSRSTRRSRRR